MGKKIAFDLDSAEAAAFADFHRDMARADPGAEWCEASLAKDVLISLVIEHLRLVAASGRMH